MLGAGDAILEYLFLAPFGIAQHLDETSPLAFLDAGDVELAVGALNRHPGRNRPNPKTSSPGAAVGPKQGAGAEQSEDTFLRRDLDRLAGPGTHPMQVSGQRHYRGVDARLKVGLLAEKFGGRQFRKRRAGGVDRGEAA